MQTHTHTLPNERLGWGNANSYTNGCGRIPLLTRNPLKQALLGVKEATCTAIMRQMTSEETRSKQAGQREQLHEHRGPLQEQARTRAH